MADSVSFRFECGDLPADALRVASFSGEEGISRLYRFEIDLVADSAEPESDDLQHQAATLVVEGGGRRRAIDGMIARVDTLDQVEGRNVYRVTLVPLVWALTLAHDHAVYLDRTTPEILGNMIEDRLGLTSADCHERLTASYRSWPFRLQYGDSDWAFLSALMEHDGIYYFFMPGDNGERIVFCDYHDGQPQLEPATLEYASALGVESPGIGHAVHALMLRQEHLPQEVALSNYNDNTPSTPIEAVAEVDPRGVGRVSQYGQAVHDPDAARDLAAIRAEELYCAGAVYHGESTAFSLAAGHRFELTGHPRARHNRSYQLLGVEHNGHDPQVCGRINRAAEGDTPVYDNRFTAIPAGVQYRPPRTTERPRIQGTLNAHIDAEGDGTYAEVDDKGRYHVVFPFHRGFHDPERANPGKASHWLRLVQPYGGEREGMHFPLRKGARVLVGFIGGNPDLPVISGTLPTAEQPSVLRDTNLAKGTLRTAAGNLVEIDDEHPRIKFYTPCCRTYRHLGASNDEGAGDEAAGIADVTDGAARYVFLQGNNNVYLTANWKVRGGSGHDPDDDSHGKDFGLWADIPLRDQRQSELGTLHLENELSVRGEWKVGDGVRYLFPFPNKHAPDSGYDNLDATVRGQFDDAEPDRDVRMDNDLMVTRQLGDLYSYTSGTHFSFQGPQRQAFDFGPLQSYVSDSHDTDVSELLDIARNTMPAADIDEVDTPEGGEDQEYRRARWDFDLKEARLQQFEEAYILWKKYVDEDGEEANDVSTWPGSLEITGSKINEVSLEAPDDGSSQFDLIHVTARAADRADYFDDYRARYARRLTDKKVGDPVAGSDGWSGYTAGDEDRDDNPASLGEEGGDSKDVLQADIEKIAELVANGNLQRTYKDMIEATYGDPGDDSDTGAYAVSERARKAYRNAFQQLGLIQGRISVGVHDSFSYHKGRRYSYNVGPSYTENVVDSLTMGEENREKVEKVRGATWEEDMADGPGPDWTSIGADSADSLPSLTFYQEGRDSDIQVIKTHGDTYDYQKGHRRSVHVGDSVTVTRASYMAQTVKTCIDDFYNVPEPNSEAITVTEHEWRPEHQNTKSYNPHSGNLYSIKDVHWDPPSGCRTHMVTMGGIGDLTVNLQAKGAVTMNAGLVLDTTINVGSVTDVSINLLNHNDLKIGAGLIAEVIACAGRVNFTQGEVTSNFPGIKSVNTMTEMQQTVAIMSRKTLDISQSGISLEEKKAKLDRALLWCCPDGMKML